MIVVVMGRDCAKRNSVAAVLADSLGCEPIYSGTAGFGDDEVDAVAGLRGLLLEAHAGGRRAIFSAPLLPPSVCRALRETLPSVDLIRLLDRHDVQPPLTVALTLDAEMGAAVLAATARAVLQLEPLAARRT